jgi:pyrroline-5-carboxylate reductase
MKLGFIGAGHMAQALMLGFKRQQTQSVTITVHSTHQTSYEPFAATNGFQAAASNEAVLAQSEVVFLAVPAAATVALCQALAPVLKPNTILVSVAGGVSLAQLSQVVPAAQVLRVMPNVNVAINQGMTALAAPEVMTPAVYQKVVALMDTLGATVTLPEANFPIFSAIAGSAPAYADLFIDALARAGVKYGLTKVAADQIAAQTVRGSAQNLLENQLAPWLAIDQVSSPGGTTVAGLLAMEQAGLMSAVVAGIDATIAKEQAPS